MNAQEITATYDCKYPNCTKAAKSSRGPHSYCDEHRGEKRLTSSGSNGKGDAERAIKSLAALAREVDRAKARAAKLTDEAIAAKRHAEQRAAEFRRQAREVIGGDAT